MKLSKRKFILNYMRDKNEIIYELTGKWLFCKEDFIDIEDKDKTIINKMYFHLKKILKMNHQYYEHNFLYSEFSPHCYGLWKCNQCSWAVNNGMCSSYNSHWYKITNKALKRVDDNTYTNAFIYFIKWN